jgi:hypothetical protein
LFETTKEEPAAVGSNRRTLSALDNLASKSGDIEFAWEVDCTAIADIVEGVFNLCDSGSLNEHDV